MQIWVHCVGLSSARNPKNSLSLTITLTRHPGSVSKTFLRILERVFNLFFLLHSDFSLFPEISKGLQKVIFDIKNNIMAKFKGNFFEVFNLIFHPEYILFYFLLMYVYFHSWFCSRKLEHHNRLIYLQYVLALMMLAFSLNSINYLSTSNIKRPMMLKDDMCTSK